MPECVLQAYLDQIPRLRAERALEAAQVASLPYMREGAQRRWYDAQEGRLAPVERSGDGRQSPLSFNGVPMSVGAIKQRIGQVLGAGFAA